MIAHELNSVADRLEKEIDKASKHEARDAQSTSLAVKRRR
jgi:hypothetical protein